MFTLLSQIFTGIEIGTGNHALQLPLVTRITDSQAFSRDFYVDALEHYYYSWFWFAAAHLSKYASISWLLILSHILSRFLLLGALFRLGELLFQNRAVSLLAAWMGAFQLDGVIAHEQIVQPVPTHTTFAFPLLIWGLIFAFQARPIRAAMLLGLAAGCNQMTGLPAIFIAAVILAAARPRPGAWYMLASTLLLLSLMALPLRWAFKAPLPDIPVADYYTQIRGLFFVLLDPFHWTWTVYLQWLGLCVTLIIGWQLKGHTRYDRVLATALLAIVFTWMLAFLFASHPVFYKLIRLQIGRTGAIAVALSVPLVAHAVHACLPLQKRKDGLILTCIGIAWAMSHGRTSAVTLVLSCFLLRLWRASDQRRESSFRMLRIALATGIAMVVALHALLPTWREKRSGWIIRGPSPAWRDVQEWAAANTSPNAMFLPPYLANGFRVHSKRSIWLDSYDDDVMLFAPSLTAEFLGRLAELQPTGMTAKLVSRFDPIALERLCRRDAIEYVILPRETVTPWVAIYKNAEWQVIRMPV